MNLLNIFKRLQLSLLLMLYSFTSILSGQESECRSRSKLPVFLEYIKGEVNEQNTRKLVNLLGDDDFEKRELGTNLLLQLGPQVLKSQQFNDALKSSDPEIIARAKKIERVLIKEYTPYSAHEIIQVITNDLNDVLLINRTYLKKLNPLLALLLRFENYPNVREKSHEIKLLKLREQAAYEQAYKVELPAGRMEKYNNLITQWNRLKDERLELARTLQVIALGFFSDQVINNGGLSREYVTTIKMENNGDVYLVNFDSREANFAGLSLADGNDYSSVYKFTYSKFNLKKNTKKIPLDKLHRFSQWPCLIVKTEFNPNVAVNLDDIQIYITFTKSINDAPVLYFSANFSYVLEGHGSSHYVTADSTSFDTAVKSLTRKISDYLIRNSN